MSTTQRIELLIEMRKNQNVVNRRVIETNKFEISNNFEEFSEFVGSAEKTLDNIIINEEVIGMLKELKVGFSTSFANRSCDTLKERVDLLESQINHFESIRNILITNSQYEGVAKLSLEKQLEQALAKKETYNEAIEDISTIINFI